MNDFWLFAKEVGDRPSLRHILKRDDSTRAHGPGNSYWASRDLSPIKSDNKKEYMRLWHKQYRANNPERFRDKELRRRSGISAEEYDTKLAVQNGLCAICGNPEVRLNPLTQEPRALAVDHCHKTGKIRGLLCSDHNTGLGLFNDDIALLRAAIVYLESHNPV
jgi:Recombination endonuclease VII